ncbi:MAG: type II toxin-antitoxin system RelE/ParE family toxin [Bacteroidetes bacterium]|nr:type II toxin-antitoxin system RelE/ParE family toxin [Bacteroidota bacterium]
MITEFTGRFLKDLDKINQASIKKEVAEVIEAVESAPNITVIKNLKKLKGHHLAFRIRIGDYRIGLFIENNIVEFVRIAHRKDIYKVFP